MAGTSGLTPGLQLPFGVQPVNPVPVDTWSGPYYGGTAQEAIDIANSTISAAIRFQSMEVRLIINGVSKKYWYRDGIADIDLVEFASGSGSTGTAGTSGTSGSDGSSGTSGSDGSSGTSGTDGSSGTSGSDGSSGTSGSDGSSGTSGSDGSSGTSGTDGSSGTSGSSGISSNVDVLSNGTPVLVDASAINFGAGFTVSTSGTSGQVDVSATGGGAIEFYDEGTLVGTYAKVNFVGADVLASQKPGDPATINVYVPTPTFASHYNTNDGTSVGTVSESGITRRTVWISSPTSEGTPYRTGGGSNSLWADSAPSSATHTTNEPTVTFSTAQQVTGVGGDSTIEVNVYSADGTTVLATYTTPSITADTTFTSSSPNAGIAVNISSYAVDSLKYKASISVTVSIATILSNNSLSGGRYHVEIIHTTDSTTDGAQTFTYTQSDAFYDTNGTTPSFGAGAVATIAESATTSNIVTKHLSGVEYYTLTSKFEVGVDKINDLNSNTQGRSSSASTNLILSAANFGLASIGETSWSPGPGTWTGRTNLFDNTNNSYAYTNWGITSTSFRYRGPNGNATAAIYDPWNSGGTKTSSSMSILVDTFATTGNSTQYVETFNDEAFRLESDYSTAWDSTATLVNGEACVVGGTIVRPDRFFLTDPNTSTIQANLSSYKPDKNGANPNYSSLSNDASYYRQFYTTLGSSTTPIPSFTMVFAGTFVGGNALADLISENLKVFVRKIGGSGSPSNFGPTSPPLQLHGAEYNSGLFDDGNTVGNCRVGSSSGNTIDGTFGGFNATNGIYVEIRICHQSIKLDTITVSFN